MDITRRGPGKVQARARGSEQAKTEGPSPPGGPDPPMHMRAKLEL